MKFLLLVPAFLSQLVAADFNADVSSGIVAASQLAKKVSDWSSKDGLFAALNIQMYYPTLSSAVDVLSRDSSNLKSSEINTETLGQFSSNIISLLSELTRKANDFKAVFAEGIVKNDVAALNQPSADLIANLLKASSCDQIKSLKDKVDGIINEFKSADQAYGIKPVSFPTVPSC